MQGVPKKRSNFFLHLGSKVSGSFMDKVEINRIKMARNLNLKQFSLQKYCMLLIQGGGWLEVVKVNFSQCEG